MLKYITSMENNVHIILSSDQIAYIFYVVVNVISFFLYSYFASTKVNLAGKKK